MMTRANIASPFLDRAKAIVVDRETLLQYQDTASRVRGTAFFLAELFLMMRVSSMICHSFFSFINSLPFFFHNFVILAPPLY